MHFSDMDERRVYNRILWSTLLALLLNVGLTVGTEDESLHTSAPYESNVVDNEKSFVEITTLAYDVELTPVFGRDLYEGWVRIKFNCSGPTEQINLRTTNLTLNGPVYLLNEGNWVSIDDDNVDRTDDSNTLTVRFKNVLKANTLYAVDMHFNGRMKLFDDEKGVGFYSHFYHVKKENRWLGLIQFSRNENVFPVLNSLKDGGQCHISVVMYDQVDGNSYWYNMKTFSNMHTASTFKNPGRAKITFRTTLVDMDSEFIYVGHFERSKQQQSIDVWQREGDNCWTQFAENMFNFFEANYPLPETTSKLDVLLVPKSLSQWINTGHLIVFNEDRLLSNVTAFSAGEEEPLYFVGRIARSWVEKFFEPSVAPKIWVLKGIRSLMKYEAIQSQYPHWNIHRRYVSDLAEALSFDWKTTKTVTLEDSDDPSDAYFLKMTSKPLSILRMVNLAVDGKFFNPGIKKYLEELVRDGYKKKSLSEYLSREGEESKLNDLISSWANQPGYPVVTLERNLKSGMVNLSQKRFWLEKPENQTENQLWHIPVTYSTLAENNWQPKNLILLTTAESSFGVSHENIDASENWILANIQGIGYYVVNYDQENWKLLLKELAASNPLIPFLDRFKLMSDMTLLLQSGDISPTIALTAFKQLSSEDDSVLWNSVLQATGWMDKLLCRTTLYKQWNTYLRELGAKLYKIYGWKPEYQKFKKVAGLQIAGLKLSCANGEISCVEEARKIIRRPNPWADYPDDSNIVSYAYISSIVYGDESDWDLVWEKASIAMKENYTCRLCYEDFEVEALLVSLTYTRNEKKLEKLLLAALNNTNSTLSIYFFTMLKYAARFNCLSNGPYKILTDHWDKIKERVENGLDTEYLKESIGGATSCYASSYENKENFQKFQKFIEENSGKFGQFKQDFEEAARRIRNNIETIERYQHDLQIYLNGNAPAYEVKMVR